MSEVALNPMTGSGAPQAPLRTLADGRQSRRAWRAARVTVLSEFYEWGRVASTLGMLVIRAALTYWLWQALYATTKSSAGLDSRQATTYALLGVFYVAFRAVNRWAARDNMVQHMLEGTIAYWFLRPVSPRRFYCIKACGDLGYGACWGAIAYIVCLTTGVIAPPVSARAGLAALACMALGLVTLYYLRLLIDLACFWTVVNNQLVIMYEIVQNVLAGALVPLWFFPAWFAAFDRLLPFQGTLNVPLSLYIGRTPVNQFAGALEVQALWIAILAVLSTLVWRRASARVTVLGGSDDHDDGRGSRTRDPR
ncbi:MAG TPA: ABC-2 family transporter protein [Actinocrinis sp.]|uniref:ABC transporter permease n=1 Tax=Actinocrinis sp. TaxID=1920516 RepID=UPI002D72EB54|nr:ABC-2 family transporter protein [Actinocrinis sp.]HZU56824.1 ABC-2 family transporter protein [Actinocrinis sp.]